MGKKVTIFVDEDDFLRMLRNIFSTEEFSIVDWLPRKAQWELLFSSLSKSLEASSLKVNWYAASRIDFYPEGDWQSMPFQEAEKILSKIPSASEKLRTLSKEKDRRAVVNEYRYLILKNRKRMESQFEDRQALQNDIAEQGDNVEIRRFGWQACSLVEKNLYSEKAVDVGMTVDMMTQSPDFDIAVLLTGNGDFVPAVNALSQTGKQFACLNFPVSASRNPARISRNLSKTMDYIIDISIEDLSEFLGIEMLKP